MTGPPADPDRRRGKSRSAAQGGSSAREITTPPGSDRAELAGGTTKRVFQAVANALHEDSRSVISALKLRRGWGDVVNVRIHTPLSLQQREELVPFQAAIEEALGGQRHRVEIVWESFG
jgi:hypothetical protein